MKLLFVVNPISGGVDKEPFLKRAKKLCVKYGIDYTVFKTTGKNDEKNLKLVLDEMKPDKVVSVGGDGTTLFTSVVLKNTEYPMGIIPLGSANGMATELYINPKPVNALKDIIMSERIEGLDLLKINEKYFTLHIGDVGVNAQIINSYENDPNRGMATYGKYFVEQLLKLKPFKVKVIANNREYNETVFMVGICNARKYGTGIALNLIGNPMDGKFELVLINKIDSKSLIKAGLSKFDENFYDSQTGKVLQTQKADIIFDKPRLLQLDGEIIGKFEKLSIKILKGAVKLITTLENKYLID